MRALLFILLSFWLVSVGRCASVSNDPQTLFDQANQLYEQNKFKEAAALYSEILQKQGVSPNLLFNLGNARFREGRVGMAIAAFKLGLRLAPRDPDLRGNLKFVRQTLPLEARQSALQEFLSRFSLNELSVVASLLFWLLMGGLAFQQWRPASKPMLRWPLLICAGLFLLHAAAIFASVSGRLSSRQAVVIASEAQLRYGPLLESKSFAVLKDGVEVEFLDEKKDWVQVMAPGPRIGWAEKKQFLQITPESASKL